MEAGLKIDVPGKELMDALGQVIGIASEPAGPFAVPPISEMSMQKRRRTTLIHCLPAGAG